jgi:phosphoglycolate phosphatase
MTRDNTSGPTAKKGLLFDLDGTLINTLADIATAINLARADFSLPALAEEDITSQVGNGMDYLVAQTLPVGDGNLAAARERYAHHYWEHMLDQSELHDGVRTVLERFGGRPLGVVTNKPISQTEKLLEGLAVRPYFSTVLGGDSLAEMKPHPLPLLHFMREHGLAPEEVAIIGDGVNDVRAGKAAGMLTIGVTFGVSTPEQMAAEEPDHIIGHMADLLDIIS